MKIGNRSEGSDVTTTVSRRDFLIGATAIGMSVATVALGGCSSKPDAEEAANKTTPSKTLDCDVLVVGTGTAGTVASLRAAELGKKVIALEKEGVPGGTSNIAEGLFGIGSKLQKQMGISITSQEVFQDAAAYHHWAANGPVLKALCDNSGATIDWLLDKGVKFTAAIGLGQSYPTWHIFDGVVGPNLIQPLNEQAVSAGVEFLYNTPATELIMKDGKVVGVLAKDADDNALQINAPVVILCSGGFSSSKAMFEKYVGVDLGEIHTWGMPGRDGDGITMGLSSDAALHIPSAIMYCGAGVDGTSKFYDMVNLVVAYQPNLRVNEEAVRCFNEGIVFDFTAHGNALGAQSKNYSIIDTDYVNLLTNVGSFNSIPTAGFMPGDKFKGVVDALESNKNVVKADTIEELAKGLELDPVALSATVERYNAHCEAKADSDFGKDEKYLQAVKTPPYYGVKLRRTFFTTVGGLKVDDKIRVISTDGKPISGLYACGSDAGGAYGYNYDVDVASGSQQGWAATSGRLAAENAVQTYLA